MRVADQWRKIEDGLPKDWGDARLRLTLPNEDACDRAASLLGPINPGRRGSTLRFHTARRGGGTSPDAVGRLLLGLDEEGITGELELVGSGTVERPRRQPAIERSTFVATWDAAISSLPKDWSDVYAEVEVESTDWLDRGALLLAPVNPARHGQEPAFRFRVARQAGYGAAAGMTRRCLQRLDDARITGAVRILRVLSDTEHVATQGPVWYVEGRAV